MPTRYAIVWRVLPAHLRVLPRDFLLTFEVHGVGAANERLGARSLPLLKNPRNSYDTGEAHALVATLGISTKLKNTRLPGLRRAFLTGNTKNWMVPSPTNFPFLRVSLTLHFYGGYAFAFWCFLESVGDGI